MQKNTSIIILAAGKGTRMKSDKSKLLHKVGNLELVNHAINTSKKLNYDEIVIVASEENKDELAKNVDNRIKITVQKDRLGTAHAAKIGYESVKYKKNNILVICADTPLVRSETYQMLLDKLQNDTVVTVLGFNVKDITSRYGRLIVSNNNELQQIIEFKDATPEERNIPLCNGGITAINGEYFDKLMEKIDNKNASGEYYLTDMVKIAKDYGLKCSFAEATEEEVMGVNSRLDLAQAEEIFQNMKRKEFMAKGVTLLDPKTAYFSYDTEIENDVVIEQNVVILPKVKIMKGCTVKAFSYLENCTLENNVSVGPFARIRPETTLHEGARIGNFVEIKKSNIGKDVKIGHLTYIGNTDIGENTNIGAGTITCNYDGYNKFQTTIGKDNFIGSNTVFVAPIKTGDNCLTGAGSVITKNIEKDDIAITRTNQKSIKNGMIKYRERKSKK